MVDYSNDSSFVISDIPGLIAGASQGVGLGIQFLKHLSRTRVIVQIIDIYDKSFAQINEEIEELNLEINNYDERLIEKVKWLALNKIDLIEAKDLESLVNELKIKYDGILNIYCISAAKKLGTQQLMREIGNHMESAGE